MPNEDALTEIKVSTARIEEQIKALVNSTTLQHSNLSQQMEKLATKTSMDEIDERVEKLEAAQRWVVKGVLGAVFAALLSLTGLSRKFGL